MRQQFYRMENPMTYKLKSLFTLTCLSVALLGASLGVTKPVKAYGYDYSYGYGYPYPYSLYQGYEDGIREGSKLFTFTDSNKNYHYDYYGYGYGYKTGYSDGIARTRRNYPFLSLIGDTWSWAESWFK